MSLLLALAGLCSAEWSGGWPREASRRPAESPVLARDGFSRVVQAGREVVGVDTGAHVGRGDPAERPRAGRPGRRLQVLDRWPLRAAPAGLCPVGRELARPSALPGPWLWGRDRAQGQQRSSKKSGLGAVLATA